MIGDNDDLIARLQRWLPDGWFPPDVGTRIYAVLAGFASLLTSAFAALTYVRLQTRLATLTDGFVDLASFDFFGTALPRLNGEIDATFSSRIRREILRDKQTRGAIDALLFELTGFHPEITELERGADCFAWRGQFGWRGGHYGSHFWSYAVFIKTVHAGVFGIDTGAWRSELAAWRIPTFVYADPSMIVGTGLTDQQILDALDRIRPAGFTYWVWIDSLPGTLLVDDISEYVVTDTGAFVKI